MEPPYGKSHLVRDAADWWRELDFERWQHVNVRGHRFVGWHNVKMFAITPRERDILYQAVQDVCGECKSARTLGILTSVIFSYMTDEAQLGAGFEHDLIQMVAEIEYHMTSLNALLGCARYDPTERLAYS